MSRFRTPVKLPDFNYSFSYQNAVLSIGSCFAVHMHDKLSQSKFQALHNPFGILFNPVSITRCLEYLMHSQSFAADQLVFDQNRWHSLDHHGHFSKSTAAETLEGINNILEISQEFLPRVDRLLLTFGTSQAFVYRKTDTIVANCHKIPAHEFYQKVLSISEIVDALQQVLISLKKQNPSLEVLLSVSPVRHIRNGLIAQQRSKARLVLSCAQLCEALDFVQYFPSYEIVMDELRDYRFYTSDMIHPNQVAIDYIWEQFRECFFPAETTKLYQRIQQIQSAAAHRPFQPDSAVHQHFVKQQIAKIDALEKEYPDFDFTSERKSLNSLTS